MDEWYVYYVDTSGEEQLDCVKAESLIQAARKAIDRNLDLTRVIKVALKTTSGQ